MLTLALVGWLIGGDRLLHAYWYVRYACPTIYGEQVLCDEWSISHESVVHVPPAGRECDVVRFHGQPVYRAEDGNVLDLTLPISASWISLPQQGGMNQRQACHSFSRIARLIDNELWFVPPNTRDDSDEGFNTFRSRGDGPRALLAESYMGACHDAYEILLFDHHNPTSPPLRFAKPRNDAVAIVPSSDCDTIRVRHRVCRTNPLPRSDPVVVLSFVLRGGRMVPDLVAMQSTLPGPFDWRDIAAEAPSGWLRYRARQMDDGDCRELFEPAAELLYSGHVELAELMFQMTFPRWFESPSVAWKDWYAKMDEFDEFWPAFRDELSAYPR